MITHFRNIKKEHKNASVQIPNYVFEKLAINLKDGNIKQISFAYTYLVAISFLYKYAKYVDLNDGTYIQNKDLKILLGYSETTKTINHIIKKDGVLDKIGLSSTTMNYPVDFNLDNSSKINNIPIREFVTVSDIDTSNLNYTINKNIVKNKCYYIKKPLFLTEGIFNFEYGTLYEFKNTHQITIDEFLKFAEFDEMDNIDFILYSYLKHKCKNFNNGNSRKITVKSITNELCINRKTFFRHIKKLEDMNYISVEHKGWRTKKEDIDINSYCWIGV